MPLCTDIPESNHTSGSVFTIHWGGNVRAAKKAREIAQQLAQKAVNKYNADCSNGE